ncbi:MAG: PfkB family carbohydrate kinase [Anaerolineae bacterium]|nr:PfkB family carbohydrate kinase [Anaerolineae bacterium]MDW8171559.1 PfkB family carbohydrate kinase [Anaerolineae bacterium]
MSDVIVAGHLCLDILPAMQHLQPSALASPGRLFEVGPLTFATGGAVSNVGLALRQLGVDVGLMAALGDDQAAQIIRAILKRYGVDDQTIRTHPQQTSSYSVVLAAQGQDRIFLHHTGNNAIFSAADIDEDRVAQARIFHLGYPPLLPALVTDKGAPLAEIFRRVKALGVVTSLDMAHPDPSGASGRVDWHAVLYKTLPHVDLFVPSMEETLFMLRRQDYEAWQGQVLQRLSLLYLRDLAEELLALGPCLVGFKLGEKGLYLRASDDEARLQALSTLPLDQAAWRGYEGYQPAYQVQVVGTTGAGDCCYAGLLCAMLHGLGPDESASLAAAVGACNVEAADATSGVLSYEATCARLAAGWPLSDERL